MSAPVILIATAVIIGILYLFSRWTRNSASLMLTQLEGDLIDAELSFPSMSSEQCFDALDRIRLTEGLARAYLQGGNWVLMGSARAGHRAQLEEILRAGTSVLADLHEGVGLYRPEGRSAL